MNKKGKHINSLNNLKKGKSIVDIPNAIENSKKARRAKADFRKAIFDAMEKGEVTTIEEITEKFLKEVKGMNKWAVQMYWEITQNFKNREIKAKEKSNEVGQGILDHIKGLEVKKEIEVPFTPYEETGLQPE